MIPIHLAAKQLQCRSKYKVLSVGCFIYIVGIVVIITGQDFKICRFHLTDQLQEIGHNTLILFRGQDLYIPEQVSVLIDPLLRHGNGIVPGAVVRQYQIGFVVLPIVFDLPLNTFQMLHNKRALVISDDRKGKFFHKRWGSFKKYSWPLEEHRSANTACE